MKAVDYNSYPFGRTERVPSGYIYAFVRDQVNYSQTGRQEIECPHCRKTGAAKLSRLQVERQTHRSFRTVNTTCQHCGTSVSFRWYK